MTEILSYPFMQRALMAGIIVGFLGSYYGVFVIQRKMSFLGSGLSHAAFGGVALGILLRFEPLMVAVPFTIFIAVLITFLKEKTNLESDTAIGILFSFSVALGIIFLSMSKGYTADAFAYLFGSILAVMPVDIWMGAALVLFTIIISAKMWPLWAYSTFDRQLARTDRLPVSMEDYALNILIAVTIVVSIKLVGIILIAAFLVLPAATARLISSSFIKMTYISIIIGITSSVAGLLISFYLDFPSGAMIIITQTTFFVFAIILKKILHY